MTIRLAEISPRDMAVLRSANWQKVSLADAVKALQMWNADHVKSEIASELGRSKGSIRSLLARIQVMGVTYRKAMLISEVAALKRAAFRAGLDDREGKFQALRRGGMSLRQIRAELNLTDSVGDKLNQLWRAEFMVKDGPTDDTCPKWTKDPEHVRACLTAGGFVALSERRLPRGGIVACLPLVHPVQTA
jgi:transposase